MLTKSLLVLSVLVSSTLGLIAKPWQDDQAAVQKPQDPGTRALGQSNSNPRTPGFQNQARGGQGQRSVAEFEQGFRRNLDGRLSAGGGSGGGPGAVLPPLSYGSGSAFGRGMGGNPSTQNPFGVARFPAAISPQDQQLRNRISVAIEALRSADGDSAREAAKSELASALSEDYDARMDEYQNYLDDLEKKLEEMKGKLQRRRQAKEDMVRLRLQVVEAEADDLGWPTGIRGNDGLGRTFFQPQDGNLQVPAAQNQFSTPSGSAKQLFDARISQ